MNYVSRERVCVAYPQTTFLCEGLQAFPSGVETSFNVGPRNILFRNFEGCFPRFACGGSERTFGDDFCAVTAFCESSATYGSIFWKLGGEPCGSQCPSHVRSIYTL